ncbi:MAG: hypothetical protein ACE5I7_08855 [Candidatus Binatia bacterium]
MSAHAVEQSSAARPRGSAAEALSLADCLGVFLVSAAALMVEVGLTRIFSFTYWYHFAYLLISVALLGIGAAGSFLTAFPRVFNARPTLVLTSSAAIAAAGCLAILLVVAWGDLSPAALLGQPGDWIPLLALYAVLLLPFFCTGLIVAGLLSRFPEHTARLYFFDLVGAGCGCFLIVQLLWLVSGTKAILLAASLYAVAPLTFRTGRKLSWFPAAAWATAFVITTSWLWRADGHALSMHPAPKKAMRNLLRDGGAHLEYTRRTPICRVDVGGWDSAARSGELGMWSLWGMSRHFAGAFPAQKYFAQDGDACTSMYQYHGNPHEMEFLQYNILKTPYLFLHRPHVLIIGLGGGTDVQVAVLNGAGHVTGVDINPVMVDLVANRYRDWNGGLYHRHDVTVHVDEGRSFVRRTSARYDLIQLTGVDTLAALSSGAYVLSESYLYTVEAMQDLWRRLTPGGLLSLTIAEEDLKLGGSSPADLRTPRFTTRLLAVLGAALRREGVRHPADHWLVVTNDRATLNTKMVSILTKKAPWTSGELERYRRFVTAMGFQSWYHPGMDPEQAPLARFIGFNPRQRARFFRRSYLNMTPTTDDNPFFFNYYKWASLLSKPELQKGRPARSYAEGQMVLVLMLLQGVVLSVLLIGLPLLRLRQQHPRAPRLSLPIGTYFAALGVGFIFIEIGLIQEFTLFLGYPTYALSCVLAVLLVCSGIGSLHTQRVADAGLTAAITRCLGYFTALVLLLVWIYPQLIQAALTIPLPWRIMLTVVLLAPFGLAMGRFFPLGLRLVGRAAPAYVPWAWAINGCCSVIGTTLAVIVAISLGFRNLFVLALLIYILGTLALRSWARRAALLVTRTQ